MKRYQIRRFGYGQNIKICAILYFIVSLIYVPIGIVALAASESQDDTFGGYVMLAMPIIMPLVTAIFVLIGIAIYNGLAKRMGGFDFTLEERDS